MSDKKMHYSSDGKDAYDILTEFKECPIRLPKATSLTQASIDFFHLQDQIIEWYEKSLN